MSANPLPWTRTSHDGLLTLTVASNGSYTAQVAPPSSVPWPTLRSPAPHGVLPGQAVATSGKDAALGAFDELVMPTANNSAVAIRWFRDADAFVFLRRSTAPVAGEKSGGKSGGKSGSAPLVFPNFWFDTYALGNATRCVLILILNLPNPNPNPKPKPT